MKLPEGFKLLEAGSREKHSIKPRTLYGLKQSRRMWHISEYLIKEVSKMILFVHVHS
jgi:hypothetical protein